MRALLILTMTLLAAAPQGAQAGAWLREAGTGFTAVSFNATYFRDMTNGTYIEYGLREDLTLGVDIGFVTTHAGAQSGFATAFIRRPLGANDGASAWAYELGIGAGWSGDLVMPHVKTGVSWGRGITVKDRSGWVSVDASVRWELSGDAHLTKVDTTFGMNFSDKTTGMVQLYLAHLDGEAFGTLAPSVVFKPAGSKMRFQVGFDAPLEDPDNTSLKLGIWRNF